jgi:hypothetical protein
LCPALIRRLEIDASVFYAGSKINVAEHHVSLDSPVT